MGVLIFAVTFVVYAVQCAGPAADDGWMMVALERNIRTLTNMAVEYDPSVLLDGAGVEVSQLHPSVNAHKITRVVNPNGSRHTCGMQTGTIGGIKFCTVSFKGSRYKAKQQKVFSDDFIVPDKKKFTPEQIKLYQALTRRLSIGHSYDIPDYWKDFFNDFSSQNICDIEEPLYLSTGAIEEEQKWFESDEENEWEIVPEDIVPDDHIPDAILKTTERHKEQCDKDRTFVCIDPTKRQLVLDVIKLIAWEKQDKFLFDFLCAITGLQVD